MFLHNILLSILFTVKGHDNLLNISIGILNAQTVIACQTSMNIYFSFIPSQILRCPHVIIQEDIMQSIHIKIRKRLCGLIHFIMFLYCSHSR